MNRILINFFVVAFQCYNDFWEFTSLFYFSLWISSVYVFLLSCDCLCFAKIVAFFSGVRFMWGCGREKVLLSWFSLESHRSFDSHAFSIVGVITNRCCWTSWGFSPLTFWLLCVLTFMWFVLISHSVKSVYCDKALLVQRVAQICDLCVTCDRFRTLHALRIVIYCNLYFSVVLIFACQT